MYLRTEHLGQKPESTMQNSKAHAMLSRSCVFYDSSRPHMMCMAELAVLRLQGIDHGEQPVNVCT